MEQQPRPKLAVISDAAAEATLRKDVEELTRMGLIRKVPGERFELTDNGRIALLEGDLERIEELAGAVWADINTILQEFR